MSCCTLIVAHDVMLYSHRCPRCDRQSCFNRMMLFVSRLHFTMQIIRWHVQIQAFENNLLDHLSYESEVGDGTIVH